MTKAQRKLIEAKRIQNAIEELSGEVNGINFYTPTGFKNIFTKYHPVKHVQEFHTKLVELVKELRQDLQSELDGMLK